MPHVSKLARARKARGWTIYEAARRAGVGDQQLRNLEEGATKISEVRVKTLIGICAAFYPDLRLTDLLPNQPFQLEPRNADARRDLCARV